MESVYQENTKKLLKNISSKITFPVNVWGLSDLAWFVIANSNIEILDLIDNDPRYRGQTIASRQVVDGPTNLEPIAVFSNLQKSALVENIRSRQLPNLLLVF